MKILPREQFDLLTMQCDCNRYFETSKDNSLLLFDNAYPYYSSLLNGFGKVSMFPFHHFSLPVTRFSIDLILRTDKLFS